MVSSEATNGRTRNNDREGEARTSARASTRNSSCCADEVASSAGDLQELVEFCTDLFDFANLGILA